MQQRTYFFLQFMLLLFWVCPDLLAIVSVEQERFKILKPGLQGSVEGSSQRRSGNSTQDSWTAGTALRWGGQSSEWLWLSNRSYSAAGGVEIIDKGWTHVRWYHPSTTPFGFEAFTQLSKNTFTLIEARLIVGAGTRIRLHEEANKEMNFLGLGAFYEKEILLGQYLNPVLRGNFYWSWFVQSQNSKFEWGEVLYIQPNVRSPVDHRILEQLTFKIHLSDQVFLHLGVNLSLNNRPAIGVKKVDGTYQLTLGSNF